MAAKPARKKLDTSQVKKYFFPTEAIPKLSCHDKKANELISQEKPVVLVDTGVCDSALKWDVDYLKANLGHERNTVFVSPTENFKYFDDGKISSHVPEFVPSMKRIDLTFEEFAKILDGWKPGDDRLYLQQALNNTVGEGIVRDFLKFNWQWLSFQQKSNNWGPLTSNLLLVGMEGNTTPVHYDEQQNFFGQLVGYKHCILFSPEHYENFYPHPVYHPHDRQSQVDINNPDFKRFPQLQNVKGYETVVGPGELLYIPIYWWHIVQSVPQNGYTVSITFWYKASATDKIEYPLLPRQKLAMMRNVEKMLLEALKDPKEVRALLSAIVLGRYNEDAEVSHG